MSDRSGMPIIVIDALGVSATALCVVGCFLFASVWGEDAARELRELKALVNAGRTDLAQVGAAGEAQQALLAEREAELATTGHLPTHTPTEAYFQTLSSYADACGLRVVRNQPLQSRVYPGLLELRYSYEVAGETQGILRFLRAVEQADFWADISYLKLDARAFSGKGAADERSADERSAMLTFSLFSAPPAEDPTHEG